MTRRQMFDAAFSVLCFCSLLWAVWTLGYYFGAMRVCEAAVKAGHATKTEASDGTHYYFKAVKE